MTHLADVLAAHITERRAEALRQAADGMETEPQWDLVGDDDDPAMRIRGRAWHVQWLRDRAALSTASRAKQ